MSWILRPAAWFATASMATTVLHELAHACAAYLLGVRSTLFNYFVDLDLTAAQAAGGERALIAVAGPGFCLVLGALAWIALRRARGGSGELPLLYLTVFGVATFFGNLISASFAGDFSMAAIALDLPMSVRYLMSAIGAVGAAAIHFWAGRELVRIIPATAGKVAGALGVVALPVALGTAAVIFVNQPMPATFATVRVGEASFWIFAVLGALSRTEPSQRARALLRLRWLDGAALLITVLVVRLLVPGVQFSPY